MKFNIMTFPHSIIYKEFNQSVLKFMWGKICGFKIKLKNNLVGKIAFH